MRVDTEEGACAAWRHSVSAVLLAILMRHWSADRWWVRTQPIPKHTCCVFVAIGNNNLNEVNFSSLNCTLGRQRGRSDSESDSPSSNTSPVVGRHRAAPAHPQRRRRCPVSRPSQKPSESVASRRLYTRILEDSTRTRTTTCFRFVDALAAPCQPTTLDVCLLPTPALARWPVAERIPSDRTRTTLSFMLSANWRHTGTPGMARLEA